MIDSKDLPRYVGEEYILQFIRWMTPYREDVSTPVLEHCRGDNVPILSEETKSLLAVLLQMKMPTRILEIGTAYGFSAIFMSQFLKDGGLIHTIERNPVMIEQARRHIEAAGLAGTITLYEGHAQEILKSLTGPYDMVLMDASMGQYGIFWEEIQTFLSPGAWVMADNVLHGGMVAKPRLEVPRRQRTIHSRLRSFLETVLQDERYQTSLLPIGDGVLLAVRKGEKKNEKTGIAGSCRRT